MVACIQQLLAELAQIRHEKCEANGLVQILQSKLANAQEENFDLRANMVTLEAETKYFTQKSQEVMQTKLNSLESQLVFMKQQLQQAERTRLMVLKEKEMAVQKQLLECKRLEAEKKLLQTQKRHQEQAFMMASQSMAMTRSPAVVQTPSPCSDASPRTGVLHRKSMLSASQFHASGVDAASGGGSPASISCQSQPIRVVSSSSPYSSQFASPKRALSSPTTMRKLVSLGVQTESTTTSTEQPSCSRLTQVNAQVIANLMDCFPQDLFTLLNGGTRPSSQALDHRSKSESVHTSSPMNSPAHANVTMARPVASTFVGETQPSVQVSLPVSASNNSQSLLSQLVCSHAGVTGATHVSRAGNNMPAMMRRPRGSSIPGGSTSRFGLTTSQKHRHDSPVIDEWTLASELYQVLRSMLLGQASSTSLAPVFIKYLSVGPSTKLPDELLASVLQVLSFFMSRDVNFQEWIEASSSDPVNPSGSFAATMVSSDLANSPGTTHLRIESENKTKTLRLQSLTQVVAMLHRENALISGKDHGRDESSNVIVQAEQAVQAAQHRTQLLRAVCRVVQNYEQMAHVMENGLNVLSVWIQLCSNVKHQLGQDSSQLQLHGIGASLEPLGPLMANHVLQQVVLAPKSSFQLKGQALQVLVQLLIAVPHWFDTFEVYARQHLMVNRLVQLLSVDSHDNGSQDHYSNSHRLLQLQILDVVWLLLTTFASRGLRLVMDNNRGQAAPKHQQLHQQSNQTQHSIVFYLVQLLDRETWHGRLTGHFRCVKPGEIKVLWHEAPGRVALVQEAFLLLSFLVRYVDLSRELENLQQFQTLQSILVFLQSGIVDLPTSDFISKTAQLLFSMVTAES